MGASPPPAAPSPCRRRVPTQCIGARTAGRACSIARRTSLVARASRSRRQE
ncbi:hypothetical protein SSBG_01985 [Streptomyces sp. SPB074]|nr:hypothetical protein SSBG_01985 [Streptomyces sp. SPB074]